MDIQNEVNSDDQELAMALANISQDNNNGAADDQVTNEVFENPVEEPAEAPAAEYIEMPAPVSEPAAATDSQSLENIRKDALTELRPLVGKLDINGEEKFDICLMLLRSTDDKSLIPVAHEAARSIADETKRAQALLDVIREIDFLSTPEAPAN